MFSMKNFTMILFYKFNKLQFGSDLFNDAVISSDCIVPDGINEWWVGKGIGSERGPFEILSRSFDAGTEDPSR
jgi:hypothetical protein